MNNINVSRIVDECKNELDHVKTLIDTLGHTSLVVPYLNKYSIIRASGSIEISYKSIVADYCDFHSKTQVKRYLRKYVRENSKNPSYENICKLLKEFDENWNLEFRSRINTHPDKSRILTSVKSLVDARNEFAHGGNPTSTISDVINYFADFKTIIEILDDIIKR